MTRYRAGAVDSALKISRGRRARHRRRQRRLGRLTPIEFETVFHTQAIAA